MPEPETAATWLSVIPCVVVFVLAAWSKRTIEPLAAGVVVGLGLVVWRSEPTPGLVAGLGLVLNDLADGLLRVAGDEVIRWIILVCGLFGSLIGVQTLVGGADAIGTSLAGIVRGRRGVLIGTWLLGLAIFIDDYLNALAVGSTMRRLADRFGVSRAMLAYVVDSTAAPVCVLAPVSTWALYVAGLLEAEGVAAEGQGLATYVGLLGTIVYAWIAAALVLLVVLTGWPLIGPMRAEQKSVTPVAPAERFDQTSAQGHWRAAVTFVAPLVVVLGMVLGFGAEDANGVLKAILLGLLTAALLAWLLCGKRPAEVGDAALAGFGGMIPALAIVVVSFVLRDANEALGLTSFLIGLAEPMLSAWALPAVAFVGLSLVTFATGSYWGMYAIALPIVVPLAEQTGASTALAIGAVVSAGAFGSHACFYGDATVLSSASCGVSNMTHALTQLPYALIAAGLTVAVYLLLGLIY